MVISRREFLVDLICGLAVVSTPSVLESQSNLKNVPFNQLIGKTPGKLYGPRMRLSSLSNLDLDFDGDNYALREEAARGLESMIRAARSDGVRIRVESSWRSYERQRRIWNYRMREHLDQGLNIIDAIHKTLEYSAFPGTSRHHWGTDVDIVPKNKKPILSVDIFENDEDYVLLSAWLEKHGKDHGFLLVYTDDPSRPGFEYEPWHYSYAPLSKQMLSQFILIDTELRQPGVIGSEAISDRFMLRMKSDYCMGINPLLLPT